MNYPFSDGSPTYEVFVAVAILAVMTTVTALRVVSEACDRFVALLASGLRWTGLIRANDLHAELHRLDLLRIVLAFFVFDRFWPDFQFAIQTGNRQTATWTAIGLLLSAALGVGLATPLVALLLSLLLNLVIDNFTANVSLGSMVVANCMIPLLLAPAGHTLSVDSWLLRRPHAGFVVRALYGLWGPPNVDRIQVGRFLALVAYSTITLYSGMKHFESPTWRSGATTGLLLLSPVASPAWATQSEWIYRHAPWAYFSFSLISGYGMLLWQTLLLPLALLSRWTRRFVIVWGVMFFAFSTYVLYLKRLGVYECVLWALVFWNCWWVGPGFRQSLRVVFDDRCNMCDRVVRFLSAVDLFRTISFIPLSPNAADASTIGVVAGDVVPDLVGVTKSGSIIKGYELYLRLSWQVLLLLPLWPVLFLGRTFTIGPRIYGFLAARRRQLFGVCERSTYRPPAAWVAPTLPSRSSVARGVALSFAVLLLAFLVRYRPYAEQQYPRLAGWSRFRIGQAPLVFGIGPVDVFNEIVLKLFRNRLVAGLIGPDGTTGPVGFTAGETVATALTNRHLYIAYSDSLFCDQELARIWIGGLAQTIPPSHPYRKGTVFLEFRTWTHPTNQEFASFRYVPLKWETLCVIKANLDDPDRVSTEYVQGLR